MRTLSRPITAPLLALGAALALTLTACGSPGSSGGESPSKTSTGGAVEACAPIAGQDLVVLDDDKHLQTVDNIIPAANAAAVADDKNVLPLLDTVSSALDTDKLINLNKSVDVDRKTSKQAAADFIRTEGLTATAQSGTGKSLVVGAANFSESATLAEIYAQVLQSAGYSVRIQTLDARETYLPALENGDLSLFPEYVGTLTEFLNKRANGADAPAVASGDLDATVKALTELGEPAGLVFGTPSPAQDQNAFAVTKAFADEHQVSTLSELSQKCGGLILGAGPECVERPFCQPGLEDTYGLEFKSFTALDVGGPLTKSALRKGTISLGLVFSSDGQLG